MFFALSGFLVDPQLATRSAAASSGSLHALRSSSAQAPRAPHPARVLGVVGRAARSLVARPVVQNPRHVFALRDAERVRAVLAAVAGQRRLLEPQRRVALLPARAADRVSLMTRLGRWTVLAGTLFLSFMWWSHVPPMHLPPGLRVRSPRPVRRRRDRRVSSSSRTRRDRRIGSCVSLRRPLVRRRGRGRDARGRHVPRVATARRPAQLKLDALLHPVVRDPARPLRSLHLLTATVGRPRLENRTLALCSASISFSLYLWH